MKSLSDWLSHPILAEDYLAFEEKYLAHIPKKGEVKNAETLGQHLKLVFEHSLEICRLHGLDAAVERLILESVKQLDFFQKEIAADFLMELFTNAIAFHDFGKVNEYFQTDRMQNDDPMFKIAAPVVFEPRSGHSQLGAFIFSVFHFDKIFKLSLTTDQSSDKTKLAALTLFFSNTILLHHSSKLTPPHKKVLGNPFVEKRGQLTKYLTLYKGFPAATVFDNLAPGIEQFFNSFFQKPADFPLFALLRLNFSLLTASDYLATWHYGYGKCPETDQDWGVFSQGKRAALISAARTSKEYNADAYRFFETGDYVFQDPQEASSQNLNTLRTEMAVRVLQQLEKHPNDLLFYLEAPTGGGKTNLSMLAVAELMRQNPELNKVFYVFPFTTLITQTHKAIKETLKLENEDIALLHSRAGFQTLSEMDKAKKSAEGDEKATEEENEDGVYGDRRRDFLQNLFVLYPFTLLTHVRFFDILKSKRKDNIYLMHRLANSVVVLDELQSYPPLQWDKMMFMLNEYGNFFNIRFILMSATLPRIDKIGAVKQVSPDMPTATDLLPNPGEYFRNPNFKGRVKFKFDLLENRESDITLQELAATVCEKSRERAAESDGRVFTIVEFIFKKSATEFRGVIGGLEEQEVFFGENIFVLSGTILESRRREIIAFLKKNIKTEGMKVLLITTQVVEAGVDIDMDLGFKNVSLIDSDEQLAGRVNRNVSKQDCEVYLFKVNEPDVLHSSDLRFKITRKLPPAFHREILETKDFGKLYERVFAEIDKRNRSEMVENFSKDYLGLIQQLDFPEADKKFPIIDQETISVFVPVSLPVFIENEEGKQEQFFTDLELNFLKKAAIWEEESPDVDGERVWRVYRQISLNKEKTTDYIGSKIEQKTLQGILSKFTFSLFGSDTNRLALRSYCNPDDCFENYFYLTRHRDLYDLKSGLNESILKNPDKFF